MKYYFAPMEGITGYLFRNVHHEIYSGIAKYFTPFVTPGSEKGIGARGQKDVLPEYNRNIPLVPQVLTNQAPAFLRTAKILRGYGYPEINLNLGCPSGTVVPKKKGAGFLAFPDELDRFFDEVFSDPAVISKEFVISVKTRIGKLSPDEWPRLMEIYNRYPLHELIIHPRIQTDLYKNQPNLPVFASALAESKNPLVYNGDIFSQDDFDAFHKRFPTVQTVMLGRGLLKNPGLSEALCAREAGKEAEPFDVSKAKYFLSRLTEEYRRSFSGDRAVLFKLKELWFYLIHSFPNAGKLEKKLKKSSSLEEYEEIVERIFETLG